MNILTTVIKDMSTERSGDGFCPLRILFILVIIVYVALSIYDVLATPGYHFMEHAKDFAEGIKDIFLGGLSIAAKAVTEPKADS